MEQFYAIILLVVYLWQASSLANTYTYSVG